MKIIQNFKVTSFCLMNQEESICHSYVNDITCFANEIPDEYNSSQKIKDYCSFIFPPGYSIFIEKFVLEDFSPNNFVLLNGKPLQYTSELEWTNRRNLFWETLTSGHPLREKSNRRTNQCIQSLKV